MSAQTIRNMVLLHAKNAAKKLIPRYKKKDGNWCFMYTYPILDRYQPLFPCEEYHEFDRENCKDNASFVLVVISPLVTTSPIIVTSQNNIEVRIKCVPHMLELMETWSEMS